MNAPVIYTPMIKHRVAQGSAEWHSLRSGYFTASEAPAMMGASKHQTRQQLLTAKATGIKEEITPQKQALFDRGHAAEAAMRRIVEKKIGEELSTLTGSREVEGLPLLASFDGIDTLNTVVFEHKLLNASLVKDIANLDLPAQYYWQIEHQLLVSGADECLFVCSDGTEENSASMTYQSQPSRRAALIEGWKLFAKDLAAFTPAEATAPAAVGEAVEALPSLTYKASYTSTGLELTSNLDIYKAAALRLVEQSKKPLETDQDFANAENRIKACKAAEERISAVREAVLAEVCDIDTFSRDLASIAEMLRQCRLNEEKQVKSRKEHIKAALIQKAFAALEQHNAEAAAAIKAEWNITPAFKKPDFATAIKGLKTVASVENRIADELAKAKLEASAEVGRTSAMLSQSATALKDYAFLFSDLQSLMRFSEAEFATVVNGRVSEYAFKAEQARQRAEAAQQAEKAIKQEAEQEKSCLHPAFNKTPNQTDFEQAAPYAAPPVAAPPILTPFDRGVIVGLEAALEIVASGDYTTAQICIELAQRIENLKAGKHGQA